ncbi:M56 family metallopeptidase [Roseburia hominis]|uniref:M56 family metallopeptidase n=1 Tax=Roseburia hominis TaxID=301301 RepID=UPI001C031FF9|nr:M56 family metallopeptidase [Roseburia hominis]MBT9643739.1 hypothetical protein [Roseburia hominis]
MNIANQILFAVVITSVTGTAAYGLWRLLMNSRFCTKPQYVYLALFLVCLLYLIPLDYGWMQMTIHGYLQKEGIWQINFSLTGFLWILAFFAAVCWLALMAKGITEFAGSLRGMKRIQMRDIPEEEEAVREEFARVKKKLGIRSNIRLYRNDRITSPMLAGIFRCRVVLPDIAYDRKHLSVIFHHELMHYKSHDPFIRLCGMCVTAVHHINPLTGNLMALLDEWSEIYCDARAIAAISDEMDAGCYFEMIIESVKHSPVTDENYIFSMLYENQRRLERRIEYMGKYNGKAASRLASMCFAAAFVLVSVTPVYAAGNGAADVHDDIYQNVEAVTADGGEEIVLEEQQILGVMDRSYDTLEYAYPELEVISPLLSANEMATFNWNVSPGTRMVSNQFWVSKGQTIHIGSTAVPDSSKYWIGIMDGLNNARYVEGSGSLAHDFAITSSGHYRVFVQNKSSVQINAAGSYYFN